MLVLHHANVYTQTPNQPQVSAIAIDHGRIVALGSDDEMFSFAPANSKKINMEGKTIWPGLTDAHMHMQYYALGLQYVDCETTTRTECLNRVSQRANQLAPGSWLRGHGWNQNVWAEGFGDAAILDAVSGDHPAYLTAKSLHAAWANSAALQAVGINRSTPDPQGGQIVRDPQGNPTGILLESAMSLVEDHIPSPTQDEIIQAFSFAQEQLWRMGLTGIHDFDRRESFAAFQVMDAQDRLRLRVVKSIPVESLDHAIALGLRTGFGSNFLRIGSAKLFADGALGPRTAAMLSPYEGESQYTGFPLLDAEQIFEIGAKATQAGISLAIHAIGDRANHEVLNAYAQLRAFEEANNLSTLRHRIEHVQLLHPDDLSRLAELAVIASMQPVHATSDMDIAEQHWGKRSALAYAWQSLLQSKAHLAFGSDAPVESPNPFLGLHAAVTRCRSNGYPDPAGWIPEQKLTLTQALTGFTTGAAYAAYCENHLGQLTPGFFADMIILEQDPTTLPPEDLWSVQPCATMVSGEWVWQA